MFSSCDSIHANFKDLGLTETYDLRIMWKKADRFLPPNMGELLSMVVRKVIVVRGSPEWDIIVAARKAAFEALDEDLVASWSVTQAASAKDIASAPLFLATVRASVEPAGEECGTRYNLSSACPTCGAGRKRIGPLRLRTAAIGKSIDFAKTIAWDELVVTERSAEILSTMAKGLKLSAVVSVSKADRRKWFALDPTSNVVSLAPATLAGDNPFDPPNHRRQTKFRCPAGDTVGLRLLSQVRVHRDDWSGKNLAFSREFLGLHSNLVRPYRLLLVSPDTRTAIIRAKLRGIAFAVAALS